MAKKQNFIVGSTNPNTNTWTSSQLNNGWDKYQVLKSGDLDGVFNAVSDYSNDSSQEIWNAIRILKGSNPTGASTNELGNIISTVLGTKATKATDFITPLTSNNKGATAADLNTLREEIETSSLTFKGYVSTSAPSSSTYGLVEGNIWINASAMPTTFPVAIAGIWNGTSWATTTDTYTVKDFDFFRNINDNEGYYWFGGQWTVMSTDMSTTYFTLNQTSGKWEIKPSVNLPGSPTTTTPTSSSPDNQIATKKYVDEAIAPLPTTTYFPDLFDVKWADHICNDVQWLRADTFSWQSGAVYQVAYQHLVDDYNEASTTSYWSPAIQDTNLGANYWDGLAWDGSKFVALGADGHISTSTDGTNWTAAVQNTNLGAHDWYALAWNGSKFVALGNRGYISTSTDGTTWTPAVQDTINLGGSHSWISLAWSGSKFVALGTAGHISTSTDGTNWTPAVEDSNLGRRANWRALAWSGSKFVALGADGHISTSTDGTNWTPAAQDSNLGEHNWRAFAFNGSMFVAISVYGHISTSTDGTTWSTATQNANLGENAWYDLAWNGSEFVALGQSGYTAFQASYQTETISGITIEYYLAEDGHKIVLADQESNVMAIYNATGVAWYYILDTENQRFKLPRTKFGFTGIRNSVGKFVEAGLPDHNHSITTYSSLYPWAGNAGTTWEGTKAATTGNASDSNPIYGNSDTVQPKATEMYLYFYVGNFTQAALENTAGITTEEMNNKVNIGHEVIEFQAPTAANNYTWYRKYRDGWVEQGQYTTTTSGQITQFNYPVAMSDPNYTLQITPAYFNSSSGATVNVVTKTETGFSAWGNQNGQAGYWAVPCSWQVSGMYAQ